MVDGEEGFAGWELRATEDGSPTFVHRGHGEACHSRSGAWSEGRERYAGPCRVEETGRARGRVRLLDVGTGVGWNLAAALEAAGRSGAALEAWSLERPEALEATLRLFEAGFHGGPGELWHAPVRRALVAARQGGGVSWERCGPPPAGGVLRLCLGDARETLPALPPAVRFDAVFLDPFSPRRAPELWEPAFLGEIARRMVPGSWLSTFSASLEVRARLRSAGLRVGIGPSVGAKREGTLASPDLPPPPFDERTRRRLDRRVRARGAGRGGRGAGWGGPRGSDPAEPE